MRLLELQEMTVDIDLIVEEGFGEVSEFKGVVLVRCFEDCISSEMFEDIHRKDRVIDQ